MKKEILFAIAAGGAFGLAIAFGIWRINANLRPKSDNTSTSTSKTSSPSSNPDNPTQTQDFKVVLEKPDNMEVLTDTPTVVSGLTRANTWVAISGESGDDIINASSAGSFNSNIDLEGGANQIKISAFDTDGSEADANLLTVYSSQYTPDASSSAESISYIGTVTDVSDSVIQIKDANGDIQQIKGTSNANYIDTRNNATKVISETDVAIGDFLIGMGTKDSNNILNASRVVITDPLATTTRRAFYGVVTDDSGVNKFIAKNPKTNETITITPTTDITVTGGETSFGKISNNEKVIAVGEFSDGTLTARSIQVLE